jgi:AhpD family alkylhydroperoxidase
MINDKLMKFQKRRYKSLKDLFRDLSFLIQNQNHFKDMESISLAFRERLMLAVTAVNGCRYCSYFHAKQALKSGITAEEITRLLSGSTANCLEDDAVAVIFAQHWAESDACPDPEAFQRLLQTYGVYKAETIHMALRIIRFANLLGNSWDYLIFRMSFGKCRGEDSWRQ